MPQGKDRDQTGWPASRGGEGVPRLQGREGRTQCPHGYRLSHLLGVEWRPMCVRAESPLIAGIGSDPG